jgi:hypothetical protein
MSHRCHAHDCPADALLELPFCLRHWRRCPAPLQSDLWRYWRPAGTATPPSLDTMRKAVEALARVEKLP